jgi:hypothetical protein
MNEWIKDRLSSIRAQRIEYVPFKIFQFYGYFLGGLIPVTICIIFESIGLNPSIIESNAIGFIMALTLFSYLLGVAVMHFKAEHALLKIFRYSFLFQAIFSFFFIHILVLYSGGAKNSIFSFSYLYLPSIVGFSFGRGINLYGASIVLAISCYFNLFQISSQQRCLFKVIKFFDQIELNCYKRIVDEAWIYFFIFCIQLFITVIIAIKRQE